MLAELTAMQAALTALGRGPAHLVTAPNSSTRHFIVAPAGGDRGELPLSDASSVWDLPVRVKAASLTTDGAMLDLAAARDALTPSGAPGSLSVTGRAVRLVFVRHEADYVDDITVTDALAVSVDSYRLVSVPA